jgi:putative endonuclease
MHWLYVLQSEKDGKLYKGISNDVRRRLSDHNSGRAPATRHRRPFILVYQEEFPMRAAAMARERYFKTAEGGAQMQRLIREQPPDPPD